METLSQPFGGNILIPECLRDTGTESVEEDIDDLRQELNYSTVFMDIQNEKIAGLKRLCREHSVPEEEVRKAAEIPIPSMSRW